jgi:hypothetical protein
MFGFLGFKNIAIALVFVFVATFAWSIVDNYTTLSGKVSELQRENDKLTSRLDWCNRRVLRRDESIEAVGGQCAAKIKQFIKDGPPVRVDPFAAGGGG